MPWILIGMGVLLSFVLYELIYVTSNAQLQLLRSGNAPQTPNAPPPDIQVRSLEQALQQLRPAHVVDLGLGLVVGLGTILMIVFAASHVGTEWAWGTLRTNLAAGASRMGFLATKYLTVLLYAVVYLVFGVAAATAASFLVSSQGNLDMSGFDPGLVASAAARGLYGFLPYIALASVIALWFRSSGGGMSPRRGTMNRTGQARRHGMSTRKIAATAASTSPSVIWLVTPALEPCCHAYHAPVNAPTAGMRMNSAHQFRNS